MEKNKIVFLCHFSNETVRQRLYLKKYTIRNSLMRLLNLQEFKIQDFAVWVSDYIEQFEECDDFEFHVIAPHMGMRKRIQEFTINGVYYHFFKQGGGFLYDLLDRKKHFAEKNDYLNNRLVIESLITSIKPSLVCLCGAENPYYSLGVIDVKDIPVYLLLQTVLHNPKLMELRGNTIRYRLDAEKKVFNRANYIGCNSSLYYNLAKSLNPYATILRNVFPSHCPPVYPESKEFDFVFFASWVAKNKGIEDTLCAFAELKKEYPLARLEVIGRIKQDYQTTLINLVSKLDLDGSVCFFSYFPVQNDMYRQVQKAKMVVVPGITAALNSTVRESMLLGLPTVVYETEATKEINSVKQNLFVAKMEDAGDLCKNMKLLFDNPDLVKSVSRQGKEYASEVFSNKLTANELYANLRAIINCHEHRIVIPNDLIFKG